MWHVVDALFSYNNVTRPPATPHMTSLTMNSAQGGNSANVLMTSNNTHGGHPNAHAPSLVSSVHASESQVSSSLFIKCALFAWGESLL